MNTDIENKSQVIDSTDVTNDESQTADSYADYEKYKFEYLKAVAAGDIKAPLLSSDISFWTHEPFVPLIGTILSFGEFEHPQYKTQQTVIVEQEDGKVVSAILTAYLQRGMAIQGGDIGDSILIVKQGQERSKYGKTFNKFQLVIEKQ